MGDVGQCKKVPSDVRYQMQENLVEDHKRVSETVREESNPSGRSAHQFEGDVLEEQDVRILGEGNSMTSKKKRHATIKIALQSKEKWNQADMTVARFFYDSCISMNASQPYYYQPMVDAIALSCIANQSIRRLKKGITVAF
ncbi:hypothetical protein Golob_013569 [Gossypium lobatum]|uniref:Uncharacterized protein n=1 Tax=Gossypium lobatum TaxID=34289 RepID=A0A7J8LPZ8_9ROSI|nr:hypothetical protein [Gossypium lobatum]